MDPLSVTASVAGLLTAASKLAHLLSTIQQADHLARKALVEITSLSALLHQLSTFISAGRRTRRMSFTSVQDFLDILSSAVLILSSISSAVPQSISISSSSTQQPMGLKDKIAWALREDEVLGLLEEMQRVKSTLSIMLAVWNAKSNLEALQRTAELSDLIRTFYVIPASGSKRTSTISERQRRRRSSLLSAMSLDQVEDIASLTLPVYPDEIANPGVYAIDSSPLPAPRLLASRRTTVINRRSQSIAKLEDVKTTPSPSAAAAMGRGRTLLARMMGVMRVKLLVSRESRGL